MRVEFGAAGWDRVAPPVRGEVVVADLETRRLALRQAGLCAGNAGKSFHWRGLQPVLFKMDSTLRGNYLAESKSLHKALRTRLTWLVPANPGQGRWTVEGRVFVDGSPLEGTAFAADPLHPVESGRVGGRKSVNLRMDEVTAGPVRSRAAALGTFLVSADAMDGGDLLRIAGMVGRRDMVFGASPIAGFLLGRPPRQGRLKVPLQGKWLGIIGSLNPHTQAQVKALEKIPGVRVSWMRPRHLAGGRLPEAPRGVQAWFLALEQSSFRNRLKAGNSLALGNRMAARLGDIAAACAGVFRPSGLLLSGGLTAIGVCEKAGIRGLLLSDEIMPGLVLSRAVWNGPALAIITKPGGFGAEDALVKTIKMVRRA